MRRAGNADAVFAWQERIYLRQDPPQIPLRFLGRMAQNPHGGKAIGSDKSRNATHPTCKVARGTAGHLDDPSPAHAETALWDTNNRDAQSSQVVQQQSALSSGDNLRLASAICGEGVRSDAFLEIGCYVLAVTMRLRLRCLCDENGENPFSLQNSLEKFACDTQNCLRLRLRCRGALSQSSSTCLASCWPLVVGLRETQNST